MNTFTALDVAKYFVELANRIDENDLTNLKLQKLLYFAQGHYYANNRRLLFQDDIEAWNLGPLVKNVYHTFKQCGAFPITLFDIKLDTSELTAEMKSFLDEIWGNYGKFSANHLVTMTHKQGTPWDKAFKQGQNTVISVEDLAQHFHKISG